MPESPCYLKDLVSGNLVSMTRLSSQKYPVLTCVGLGNTSQIPWSFCSRFESYKSESAGFVSRLTVALSLIKLNIDTLSASNSNWALSSGFEISSWKKARTNSRKFLEKLLISFHFSICLLLPSHSETIIYFFLFLTKNKLRKVGIILLQQLYVIQHMLCLFIFITCLRANLAVCKCDPKTWHSTKALAILHIWDKSG